MPIIRPQAGSRVQCYRIPDDWPVLTLNGADGRPVILTVNALGPAEALLGKVLGDRLEAVPLA